MATAYDLQWTVCGDRSPNSPVATSPEDIEEHQPLLLLNLSVPSYPFAKLVHDLDFTILVSWLKCHG